MSEEAKNGAHHIWQNISDFKSIYTSKARLWGIDFEICILQVPVNGEEGIADL